MYDHGLIKGKLSAAKVSENELEGGVVRSKNESEWEKVDYWHARGGGLLSNDWLEDKEKNRT